MSPYLTIFLYSGDWYEPLIINNLFYRGDWINHFSWLLLLEKDNTFLPKIWGGV